MIYTRFAPIGFVFVAFFAQQGCTGLEAASAPKAAHVRQDRATITYRTIVDRDLRGARVRLCVDGFRPRALEPIVSEAATGLLSPEPRTRKGDVTFPRDAKCMSYTVRFIGAPYVAPDGRFALISQSDWLWRPSPMPPSFDARVSFEVPDGVNVSVPWPETEKGVFQLAPTAFSLAAYNVLGSFQEASLHVDGVNATVADLGSALTSDTMAGWLGDAVRVVASVGKSFPAERLHVIVAPGGPGVDPVAFGMVRRGGGISVLLLPNGNASLESLRRDWVLVHELSHLWLPRLEAGGRWLSEGVATYLQEVLRARCGVHSGQTAWRKIRAGFRRGKRIRSSRSLATESLQMSRTGNYHRVYWAGTAFAMEADLRLRRESRGNMTLLKALEAGHRRWNGTSLQTADAMLRVMDEEAGTSFLRQLGQEYARRRSFPNTSRFFTRANRRTLSRIVGRDAVCVRALAENALAD